MEEFVGLLMRGDLENESGNSGRRLRIRERGGGG